MTSLDTEPCDIRDLEIDFQTIKVRVRILGDTSADGLGTHTWWIICSQPPTRCASSRKAATAVEPEYSQSELGSDFSSSTSLTAEIPSRHFSIERCRLHHSSCGPRGGVRPPVNATTMPSSTMQYKHAMLLARLTGEVKAGHVSTKITLCVFCRSRTRRQSR